MELLKTIGSYEIENDGIGSYECHGYKGFDKGTTSAMGVVIVTTDGTCEKDLDEWMMTDDNELVLMDKFEEGFNNLEDAEITDQIETFVDENGVWCFRASFEANPPEPDQADFEDAYDDEVYDNKEEPNSDDYDE